MNGSQTKYMRKQIRNVAQSIYPKAINDELVQGVDKRLTEIMNARLDKLSDSVTREVAKIDAQTQDFRRMVFQDASRQITRELFTLNTTMLAWQQVMLAELAMSADIAELEKKIEAKRSEIETKLEAEAKEKQEKEAAEAKAAAAAKAAEPPSEAPATDPAA